MRNIILLFSFGALLFSSFGCTPASQVRKVLEDNPEIVFDVIEKNPEKFIEVVNKAARQAQMQAREKEAAEEENRIEEEFKNPKKPVIADNRVTFGPADAPITIVEYSDFECPYCARGYETVKKVMKEYGDKVKVVYKHLPLDFHPLAMPAAKYYEAIAKQSAEKAEKFHDEIFENQSSLKSKKEDFLKEAAKKVGADLNQVMKDIKSDEVAAIIEADMEEAKKFGFSGTPGFLINGVSLKGAYPFPEFKKIIDRHLEKEQG